MTIVKSEQPVVIGSSIKRKEVNDLNRINLVAIETVEIQGVFRLLDYTVNVSDFYVQK